jgi:signal transduction histidine kinase
MKNLWFRVITPFVVFVVAGTVGLLLLLNATYQHRSRNEFVALATANAEFIRASRIPTTDRFAGYLSQVLGVEVAFRRVPAPNDRHEAVTVPINADTDLTLIRETPKLLFRPSTLGALTVFWGLSLALAWAVVVPYLRAQRLALLGQMATSLAHEIQNPVAAIRLHAQLAGHQTILGEAATIESLVNQWLFLARPDAPQKSPVTLDALLADTIRVSTPLAEHAHVRIELVCGSGFPAATIDGDARRLGQVFRNLIVNAIQAMPGGGTLTITATGRTITFADTGKGFSPTALARCPELFYSEKEGGMGIGLAVVREIVHAHGGRLSLANPPTGGAEVRLEL